MRSDVIQSYAFWHGELRFYLQQDDPNSTWWITSPNLQSYVDDVLGHTENWPKHIDILQDFFERVSKACDLSYF